MVNQILDPVNNNQVIRPAAPAKSEVISKIELPEYKPSAPAKGKAISLTAEKQSTMTNSVKMYLNKANDPQSIQARINVSRYVADITGASFGDVYKNYESVVENIWGRKLNPKSAAQFITDQFKAGVIQTKIADIQASIAATPDKDHSIEMAELAALEKDMPPVDPFKHNIFLDASGIAANMIPYIWTIGKYAIPGAALTAGAALIPGGEGAAVPMAAQTISTVGKFVSVFGRVKSFQEGYRQSVGIIYGSLTSLEDSKGNKIDPHIASKISLIAGIPYAGLEAIGAEYMVTNNSVFKSILKKIPKTKLNKMLGSTALKVMAKMGIKQDFAKAALKIAKGGAEAVTYEVLLEEVPQSLIEQQAQEFAKEFTNELDGSEFVKAAPEDWKNLIYDTIVQSTKGVLLLKAAGGLARSSLGKAAEGILAQSTEVTDSDIETLEDLWDKEQDIIALRRVSTDIKETEAIIKTPTNKTVAKVEYDITDDSISIKDVTTDDKIIMDQAISQIQEAFPDKNIVSENETVNNAIEDLNPEIKIHNMRIRYAKLDIEGSEKLIEKLKAALDETQTEDQKAYFNKEIQALQESIDVSRETIKQAEEAKAKLTKKPIYKIKKEEAAKILNFPMDNKAIEDDIRSKLPSNFSKEEKDASLAMLKMIASAVNKPLNKFVDDYFQSEKVRQVKTFKNRSSVSFDSEGKALIKLTKTSNFSTWVHEVGHILRQHLNPEDYKIATEWAVEQTMSLDEMEKKLETSKSDKEKKKLKKDIKALKNGEWTVDMEEAFAQAYESYIYEGKTPHTGIKHIFDMLSKIMRSVYDNLRKLRPIDDKIRKVFDNQLGEIATETDDNAIELFQTEYIDKIKDAVDKGLNVPDEVIEQFKGEEWADKEIKKRETQKKALQEFDWLADIAKESKDVESFIDEVNMYMGEHIEELENLDKEWLTEFYNYATKGEGIVDINTGNKKWADSINDNYVKDLIVAVSKNIKGAEALGMPFSVTATARRFLSKKEFRDKSISVIVKTLKNNPAKYRELASMVINDMDEVRQIEIEREFSSKIGIEEDIPEAKLRKEQQDLVERIDDVLVKNAVVTKQITAKKAEWFLEKANTEIKEQRAKVAELEKEIKELEESTGEKIDAMIKSRNKEKSQEAKRLKEAVKAEHDKLMAKKKEQAQAKKLKDYMRKLAKSITKKIPSTVDATYIEAIRVLQNQVDPAYRRKSKIEERQRLRKFYKDHPDIASILPEKLIDEINSKALNEWTAAELEALKFKVDTLIYAGKDSRMRKNMVRSMRVEANISDIVHEITKNGVIEPDKNVNTGDKPKSKYRIKTNIFSPRRLADMLDAGLGEKGKDYKGAVTRIVIEGIGKAYNNEISEKHKRQKALHNKMKELGLSEFDLLKKFKIDGKDMTIDAAMDVYAGWLNEKKRAALQGGMNINKEKYKEIISHLSEKHIELIKFILDDYSKALPRLTEAFLEDKNEVLETEENYTPIRRIINGVTADEFDTVQELIDRQNIKTRASLNKKNTISRVEMKNQTPIQLGLISTWHTAVSTEEHYINNVSIIKDLNKIMWSKDVVAAANSVGKQDILRAMQKYIKRYSTPGLEKSLNGFNKTMRNLMARSGVAYLSYNLVTIAKQAPSLLYFLAYSGPVHAMTGISDSIFNYKETRALMDKYAPELTYGRSFHIFMDSINKGANSRASYIVKKVGTTGLKGIEVMDRSIVIMGWRSVFNAKIRAGLSEQDAANFASRVALLTQPAASAKDVPAIYAEDNFLSIFIQFTNQLNQIMQNIVYDAPQAIMHKHYFRGIGMWTGAIMGAMALWVIQNRRLPKDDDDYKDIMTTQFFNTLPVLGKLIGSYVDGYNLSLPVIAPVEGAARGLQLGDKLLKGLPISDRELETAIRAMGEGFAIMNGLPYTAVDRVYKGFKNGKPIQTVMLGGKINDK